uniref:Uncharacterized protein n=1 Tax=Amphimedon queenslandica TaxID=400682 RepID=A0A1X7VEI0_AMPQE
MFSCPCSLRHRHFM